MSAFEKMMSTFDAYKETAGVAHTAVNGGTSAGKTLFGGGGWGGCGAEQNKMWQDFVSGCTRDPHTTHNTAAVRQCISIVYTDVRAFVLCSTSSGNNSPVE